MPKNHTDLIDELTKRLDALTLTVETQRTLSAVETGYLKDGLRDTQALAKELQATTTKLAERVATVEQRCSALDKLADRGWQGWLALTGAGLALLVALLKK